MFCNLNKKFVRIGFIALVMTSGRVEFGLCSEGAASLKSAEASGELLDKWRALHVPSFAHDGVIRAGGSIDIVTAINDATAEINSLEYFLGDIGVITDHFNEVAEPLCKTIDWCVCTMVSLKQRYEHAMVLAEWVARNIEPSSRLFHVEFGAGKLRQLVVYSRILMALGIYKATFAAVDTIYRDKEVVARLQKAWQLLCEGRGVDFKLEFYENNDELLDAYTGRKACFSTLSIIDVMGLEGKSNDDGSIRVLETRAIEKRLFCAHYLGLYTNVNSCIPIVSREPYVIDASFSAIKKDALEKASTVFERIGLKKPAITLSGNGKPELEKDVLGNTRFHALASKVMPITNIDSFNRVTNVLTEAGVNINACNNQGQTALDLIILDNGKTKYINALIARGAVRGNILASGTKDLLSGDASSSAGAAS